MSANASSVLNCSTDSENWLSILRKREVISLYFCGSPGMMMSSGQICFASTDDMAVLTPRAFASFDAVVTTVRWRRICFTCLRVP